jgi:predicted transcriptional regulator with HTH domain
VVLGLEENKRRDNKMFDKEGKAGFEDISRSLKKSRVRSEIMMYLYNNYPEASYPAEIAKNTGIDPTNVLKGLTGTGWFGVANSLLKQGVVEKMERGNETYYRLSERGKSLIESMRE